MKLIHRCMDLFYPPKCVFCDTLLQSDERYFAAAAESGRP